MPVVKKLMPVGKGELEFPGEPEVSFSPLHRLFDALRRAAP